MNASVKILTLVLIAACFLVTQHATHANTPVRLADQGAAQAEPGHEDTLGFDASKIAPPDHSKGQPVARIFEDYLYAEDFELPAAVKELMRERQIQSGAADKPQSAEEVAAERGQKLQSLILSRLSKRYAERHNIEATPEEIIQARDSFEVPLESLPDDLRKSLEEVEASMEWWMRAYMWIQKVSMANGMVRGWKVDRALYKKYGGTVIFQQSNPMEPIGAYRRFLEDMEQGQVFEIFDPLTRAAFWEYFRREDHPFKVAPEDIDFDRPFWTRPLPRDDAADR